MNEVSANFQRGAIFLAMAAFLLALVSGMVWVEAENKNKPRIVCVKQQIRRGNSVDLSGRH